MTLESSSPEKKNPENFQDLLHLLDLLIWLNNQGDGQYEQVYLLFLSH